MGINDNQHKWNILPGFNWCPPMKQQQWFVLFFILAGFFVLKLDFNPSPVGMFGKDGSYYYQVARNIVEGNGLQTNTSLYNQGLTYLPHPAPIYPAWPILLGGMGAALGLDQAARILPEVLFFLALILLYILTNTIARTIGGSGLIFPNTPLPIDIGHLSVLILGFNTVFFIYTSLPYTEGLAFTFLFATLLSFHFTLAKNLYTWSIIAGLFAGLAYLTRSQMLGLIFIIPSVFSLLGIRDKRFFTACVLSIAASCLCVIPWIIYLFLSFSNFSPEVLVDHTQYRETPELLPYQLLVQTDTFLDMIVDRISGVSVAFNLYSKQSYANSFGLCAFIFTLPLLSVILKPNSLFKNLPRLLSPRAFIVLGTIGATILCLLPVHLLHIDRYGEWFFQFRYGLPFILVISLSLVWIFTKCSLFFKIATLLVIGVSLSSNIQSVRQELWTQEKYHPPRHAEKALAQWINTQPIRPKFLTTHPWSLGALTQGNFHEIRCHERPNQMEVFFKRLNIQRVITFRNENHCTFFTNVRELFEKEIEFDPGPKGIVVWKILSSENRARHTVTR